MANAEPKKPQSAWKRFRHWLPRTWLVYAAARAAMQFVAWLPLPCARALGRLGGWLAYHLDRGHRCVALANLQLAFPDRPEAERRVLLRACYAHLGVCAAEFCRYPSLRREDVRESWVTPEEGAAERLRAALASGHGAILVGGHLGAWELGALAMPALGFPLCSIAREVGAPRLDEFIMRVRTHFGTQLFYQEHGLFQVYRALRRGKLVGLHVDQYAGRQGTYVPFFGREASSVDTCARLHVMTGAPLFCGAFQRRADGRYTWRLRPVEAPPAKEGQGENERVREVLCACNRALEEAIRAAPEQWLWFHNRWRDHRRGAVNTATAAAEATDHSG